MRRGVVALAVAAFTWGLVTASAGAATMDAHGWWWRPQTGVLGTAVPPPGVPEDGLAVETLPDGPNAIAALRFALDEDETGAALVLAVAEQHGELEIAACAATQHWSSDHGGPWDERPTYDCGSAVQGEAAEDGTAWRWEVSSLVRRQRLNVVLVPAPGSGRVTFEAPDDSSLQTQRDRGGGDGFDAPPVSDFVAPPAASSGSADDFATSSGGGVSTTPGFTPSGGDAPAATSDAQPFTADPPDEVSGVPAPQSAGPVEPQGVATPPPLAAAPAAASESSRTVGAIVAAMMAMLGLALWHQESSIARRVGLLSAAGVGVAPQSIGGLGRFARPRSGAPRPLL